MAEKITPDQVNAEIDSPLMCAYIVGFLTQRYPELVLEAVKAYRKSSIIRETV